MAPLKDERVTFIIYLSFVMGMSLSFGVRHFLQQWVEECQAFSIRMGEVCFYLMKICMNSAILSSAGSFGNHFQRHCVEISCKQSAQAHTTYAYYLKPLLLTMLRRQNQNISLIMIQINSNSKVLPSLIGTSSQSPFRAIF